MGQGDPCGIDFNWILLPPSYILSISRPPPFGSSRSSCCVKPVSRPPLSHCFPQIFLCPPSVILCSVLFCFHSACIFLFLPSFFIACLSCHTLLLRLSVLTPTSSHHCSYLVQHKENMLIPPVHTDLPNARFRPTKCIESGPIIACHAITSLQQRSRLGCVQGVQLHACVSHAGRPTTRAKYLRMFTELLTRPKASTSFSFSLLSPNLYLLSFLPIDTLAIHQPIYPSTHIPHVRLCYSS